MKRFFSRIFAVGLISALLLGVFSFGGAFAAQSGAGDNSLNGKNWMSGIPDDRYLCEINLPGTHDSATAYCKNTTDNYVQLLGRPVFNSGEYARTQSLTLSEQLNAGVRYLDLRFAPKEGTLLLCHGNIEKVAAVNKVIKILSFFLPILKLIGGSDAPLLSLDTEFYAYEDEACTVPLTGDSVFGQRESERNPYYHRQKRKRRYRGVFTALQSADRNVENRDQSFHGAGVSLYRKRKRHLHENAHAFRGTGKDHSHDAFL